MAIICNTSTGRQQVEGRYFFPNCNESNLLCQANKPALLPAITVCIQGVGDLPDTEVEPPSNS